LPECIFCKIAKNEIPGDIIYEDESVLAFRDVNPQAPVHILIIPKDHIENVLALNEKDKDLIGHIHLVANKVAQDLGLAERGFRMVLNCKEEAGQSVPHIHFHLLGGRAMGWPPG